MADKRRMVNLLIDLVVEGLNQALDGLDHLSEAVESSQEKSVKYCPECGQKLPEDGS